MIAEGIYNPVTGETVKVQGAGSVYNEEKNSVAVGKDTVASGQDQFVLGRANVADTDKAEIVGGGVPGKSIRIGAISGLRATDVVCSLIGDKETLKAKILESNGVGYLPSTYSGTTLSSVTVNCPSGMTFHKVESAIVSERTSESEATKAFIEENYLMVLGYYEGKIYVRSSTSAGPNLTVGYYSQYNASNIVESIFTKNIRTLDWSGNEKLAGGLEIGGSLKIGSTTITEAQLQALLAIITESES